MINGIAAFLAGLIIFCPVIGIPLALLLLVGFSGNDSKHSKPESAKPVNSAWKVIIAGIRIFALCVLVYIIYKHI